MGVKRMPKERQHNTIIFKAVFNTCNSGTLLGKTFDQFLEHGKLKF